MASVNANPVEAARATWDYLEGLDSAERLDLVRDENSVSHETKCSGVLAAFVCDELGISKSEFGIYLAGAGVPGVHNMYRTALDYEEKNRPGVAKAWVKRHRPERVAEYGEPEIG